MLGIFQPADALKIARERGMDLVEISPTANPPVCKITDYGKFMYEKKKKEHEAKKNQVVVNVKEVQLRPQTDEHDIEYKFNHVKRFLQEGDKAKVTVMFRGREVTNLDVGRVMINRLLEEVKDIGVAESPPKLEGKKLMVVISPIAAAGAKPATTVVVKEKAKEKVEK